MKGPVTLGHCEDSVHEAVAKAAEKRDVVGMCTSDLEVHVAEKAAERVPSADQGAVRDDWLRDGFSRYPNRTCCDGTREDNQILGGV